MRSGYSEDCYGPELAMWRGRVASAMRGKRGQALLVDLLASLDAMPEKRLVAEEIVADTGDVCLLGAGGRARGIAEIEAVDPEDHERLAVLFNVAPCMIREIEYVNDDYLSETPEERYTRVRAWLVKQIGPKAYTQ